MPEPEESAPVKEGDILAGKYRVEGVLGIGGMGVVVSATHIDLGQRVALKFLLRAALQSPDALKRFQREARLAVQLRSDHVTRVLDVGTLDTGAPYMVMELLEGDDLGTVLEKRGMLSVGDAVDYVVQACDAVAEAHALGIVHRDLKPRNLFLTRKLNGSPHIKVLDFGISKAATVPGDHSLTKTNDVMGSPNYMAPEQLRSSKDVDGRTDIWALGVILYELVTGRVPFLAETITQLCSMVLEKEPLPVEQLCAEVPAGLAHVVARCLQKEPALRFSSVSQLAEALLPYAATFTTDRTVRFTSQPAVHLSTQNPLAKSASMGAYKVSTGTGASWGETLGGKPALHKTRRAPLRALAALAMAGLGAVGISAVKRALHSDAPSVDSAGAPTLVTEPPASSMPMPAVRKDPPPDPSSVVDSPVDAARADAARTPPRLADMGRRQPSAASAPALAPPAPSAKPVASDYLPGDRK